MADLSGRLGSRPAFAEGASGKSTVTYQFVSPEYFDVLDIDLVRGRGFTQAERNVNVAVAVVSESVARELWPGARRRRASPSARIGRRTGYAGSRMTRRRSRATSSSSASHEMWRAFEWAATGCRAQVCTCRSAQRLPKRRSRCASRRSGAHAPRARRSADSDRSEHGRRSPRCRPSQAERRIFWRFRSG